MSHMIPSRLPNGSTGMRIAPRMRPTAYRTYEVQSPLSTHWRSVSCAEVECQHYLSGWVSRFDVTTQEGKAWSSAIGRSNRRFTWTRSGNVVTFRFERGQECFQTPHKVRTGRPELYIVRDGDWRGNPSGQTRRERQPGLFVEQMEENLSHLRNKIQEG